MQFALRREMYLVRFQVLMVLCVLLPCVMGDIKENGISNYKNKKREGTKGVKFNETPGISNILKKNEDTFIKNRKFSEKGNLARGRATAAIVDDTEFDRTHTFYTVIRTIWYFIKDVVHVLQVFYLMHLMYSYVKTTFFSNRTPVAAMEMV